LPPVRFKSYTEIDAAEWLSDFAIAYGHLIHFDSEKEEMI